MEKDSVYDDLYKKLAVTPTGVPKGEKLLQILRILFTPEEAELAVILPFMPTPLSEIADATGMDLESTGRALSHMADKGLVYAAEEKGIPVFMLFGVSWTLFKFPLMNEVRGVDYQNLKRLCREFLAEDTLIGENTLNAEGKHVPIGRILPLQENLSPETEVLPQDLVYTYIDRAEHISVGACSCRKIVGACDAPKEVCMAFGYQAKYLVRERWPASSTQMRPRGFTKWPAKQASCPSHPIRGTRSARSATAVPVAVHNSERLRGTDATTSSPKEPISHRLIRTIVPAVVPVSVGVP